MHLYYLHFRQTPSADVLAAIEASGAELTQIFDSSYEVTTPDNFSTFKYFIRESFPDLVYYLANIKASLQHGE